MKRTGVLGKRLTLRAGRAASDESEVKTIALAIPLECLREPGMKSSAVGGLFHVPLTITS